jgi:hypothetical protein
MAPIDEPPMPRIGKITVAGDLRVNVTWSRGIREGVAEEINLAPIINSMKYFRPLRSDPKLFASVHPIVYGAAVAWGEDDDIDLSADAILRLTQENMTGDEMRAFIERQDLTETALAAILDYSRRQIVGFINEGRPIPRVVSLACRYIELVNPVAKPADSVPSFAVRPSIGQASQGIPSTSSSTGPVPVGDVTMAPYIIAATYTVQGHVAL